MRIPGRWVSAFDDTGDMADAAGQHMSPNTLSLLPRSPAQRRRSSGQNSPLRLIAPVYADTSPFDDEDGDVDLRGPMPIARETADERERSFGAVDEVEYAYGE